ncbi:MAG: hypothetical protein IKZ47_07800, partial [Clostridia bacterium]|nr:hypothetical protein [Clostridia bacterium]
PFGKFVPRPLEKMRRHKLLRTLNKQNFHIVEAEKRRYTGVFQGSRQRGMQILPFKAWRVRLSPDYAFAK